MSAAAPWSVKGIEPKAREIAKDLARRSGMTLGEIRHRLADRFRIEPGSTMHVNGQLVDDEHRVIRTGEHIEFLRQAGEKGIEAAFARVLL